MTNREKILKTNTYDLMMKIWEIGACPIRVVSGKSYLPRYLVCKAPDEDCSECIQKWLNQESEEVEMDKNEFECNNTGMWCYNCPHRYCHLENEKYTKLKRRTEAHIKDGLYWIDIDFERADEVSQRAFARYRKWLEADKGYVGCEPSYKEWIGYNNEDVSEPMRNRSYHTGTFYFHPKRKEE